MLDRSYVGRALAPLALDVELGRLRLFAKAIGERNPVYFDTEAAKRAGHKAPVCPPTFLFCLNMEAMKAPSPFFDEMGGDLGRLLHAEQSFALQSMAYAGDRLRAENSVQDVFEKKQGALEFIKSKTDIFTSDGAPVAEITMLTVLRNL